MAHSVPLNVQDSAEVRIAGGNSHANLISDALGIMHTVCQYVMPFMSVLPDMNTAVPAAYHCLHLGCGMPADICLYHQ